MIPAINLAGLPQVPVLEALPLCREAGFEGIGLWFEPVRQVGVAEVLRQVHDQGLRVTSLCPSGSFGDHGEAGFPAAVGHTQGAIEMAAALDAACLCILPGTYPRDRTDFALARAFARRGFDAIVPIAQAAGVTLALEPLHPMYADGYSVISTTREALAWCRDYGLSLFVDTYHVWWDRDFEAALAQASGLIAGFHVNDWYRDTQDLVTDRALPGEGVIDLPRLFAAVRATGYDAAAELEVFSQRHAQDEPKAFLRRCRESLRTCGV